MDIEVLVCIGNREMQDDGTVGWKNSHTQRIFISGTAGQKKLLIKKVNKHFEEKLKRMMDSV